MECQDGKILVRCGNFERWIAPINGMPRREVVSEEIAFYVDVRYYRGREKPDPEKTPHRSRKKVHGNVACVYMYNNYLNCRMCLSA